MSGIDVEALLESAANQANTGRLTNEEDNDDIHREERNGRRDRDRDRHRDGSRERKRRDRSADRDRRDDDMNRSPRSDGSGSRRDRDRDRERDRKRHRDSAERDGYHGRRGGGRSRSRSADRDNDRLYRPPHGRRDRGNRHYDDRRRSRSPKRSATPPLTEDERDRRTVFVQQLAARLRTKDLINFFEKVGPVKEAQIVKDRVSGKSKGVGYVEFRDESSVPLAIQLTGQKLLGIPIIAQLTEAEKNRLARATTEAAKEQSATQAPFHRLYVGNIHFSITESDLQNVFDPFGELEFVQLQKEDGGRSRGYGFVQFRDPNQAREALEKMNGFDLAGRPIRVGLGNDKFTPESTATLLHRFQGRDNYQGSSFSGSGGRGAHAGGGSQFDRLSGKDDGKSQGNVSALDDTDVAGVNYSNFSRAALMQKLARTEEPAADTRDSQRERKAAPTNGHAAPKRGAPAMMSMASRCVLLKNMFDPAEEDSDTWVRELEDDVRAECEEKYGKVVHISLDANSRGDIYIKFADVSGGENAIRGLNGRFFGGRTISATPVVDAVYSSLFSKTKDL